MGAMATARDAGVSDQGALFATAEARLREMAASAPISKVSRTLLALDTGCKTSHMLPWVGDPSHPTDANATPDSVNWNVRVLDDLSVELEISVRLKSVLEPVVVEKEARGSSFVGTLRPLQNRQLASACAAAHALEKGHGAGEAKMEIEAIYFNVSNAFSWFTGKEVEVVTVLEWPSPSKLGSPHAVPDFQRHVAPADLASTQELAAPSCAAASVTVD